MRILFDHQVFSFQDYGGISRIFYELSQRLKNGNEAIVEGKFSNNVLLKKLKKDAISVLPGFEFPKKNVFIFYLNQLFGEKLASKGDYDLLHATYYHPYFMKYLNNKPYVVTVFDMIHEVFSKDYKKLQNQTSEFKRITVTNASKIIAISENTKKDLIKIYKISGKKIDVIYLGNPLEGVTPKMITGLPAKYILFVGNRSGYKNFEFFVRAISDVIKLNEDVFLVCAGGESFTKEENKLFEDLRIKDRVCHICCNSGGEFAYIYEKALIYVIPSLYEGFGLTILEAFSMSCPVIASKVSSIPEVAGDACYYINPNSSDSIKKAITKLLKDEKLRNRLVEKGKKQLKKFSWDKCARETLKVYREVISE